MIDQVLAEFGMGLAFGVEIQIDGAVDGAVEAKAEIVLAEFVGGEEDASCLIGIGRRASHRDRLGGVVSAGVSALTLHADAHPRTVGVVLDAALDGASAISLVLHVGSDLERVLAV